MTTHSELKYPISRLFARLIPVLMALFLLPLAGLRLQPAPVTPSDLRPLLTACETACFLGIIPGSTDSQTAHEQLSAHPWVAAAQLYRDTGGQPRNLVWDWNGQQPGWLYESAVMGFRDEVVSEIGLRTTLTYADIWFAFGRPVAGNTYRDAHQADYPTFRVMFVGDCQRFWQAQVIVYLLAEQGAPQESPYDLAAARRQVCAAR